MANRYYNLKISLKKHKSRLFGIAGAAILFFILFFLTLQTNGRSLCLSYNLFQKKCIGCGMTRAFIAILKLDFTRAFRYNYISIPLFFGIVLYCILLTIDIFCKTELTDSFERILSKKQLYPIYFLLVIALSII